jgi:hypothetical protein
MACCPSCHAMPCLLVLIPPHPSSRRLPQSHCVGEDTSERWEALPTGSRLGRRYDMFLSRPPAQLSGCWPCTASGRPPEAHHIHCVLPRRRYPCVDAFIGSRRHVCHRRLSRLGKAAIAGEAPGGAWPHPTDTYYTSYGVFE